VIEAAKQFGDDEDFALRELEHVVEFAFAEDRHQRIDDRADAERRKGDYREFPPIGQLHGNDVAAIDAEPLQRSGGARDEIAEFSVAEAAALDFVRAIAEQRELVGGLSDRRPKKLVVVLVDPETAVAHRLGVRDWIEASSRHRLSPHGQAPSRASR